MTTMTEPAGQAAIQTETVNDVQEVAQAAKKKDRPAKKRRYSINDVLRLMKALEAAKTDMDREYLSMNDVVHLLQEKLEGMLKTSRCTCADLAAIITRAGFPVTERTLKEYLIRSRKDAREGNTNYDVLKEQILGLAGQDVSKNCADTTASFESGETDASDGQEASDDFGDPDKKWLASAISTALDKIEAKDMAKQHIRDIYAARKRRKKARQTRKQK